MNDPQRQTDSAKNAAAESAVDSGSESAAGTSAAEDAKAGGCGHCETAQPTRRRFGYQALTAALSVLLGLIPLIPGLGFVLTPLLRKQAGSGGSDHKDADGFIRLDVTAASLPDDGTPVMVTVFDDEVDAWNKFPQQPVGTVWLRRVDEQTIAAFSTVCPHLGCSVDYRSGRQDFFCPCHTSSFALDGSPTNQIPPRPMDSLEVKVVEDVVWLKYQNFRAATPEKIPV